MNGNEDTLYIKITTEDSNDIFYYQNKLNLEEFQALSKAFNYYKSIKEIILT